MGASAAAVIVAKEKHIVAAFRAAGAVSAERAVPPESLGVDTRLAFRRLCQRAVLREGSPGTWYLDEPSWEALRALRRRLALVMLAFVVLAFVVVWLKAR